MDKLHPITVERPFTVNPIIPLIDPIYDHVIRKYPKRSFCILRNCIRVSDLIQSTKSSVFELQRTTHEDNICSRLRSRKRKHQNQPRQKMLKKRRSNKSETKTTEAESLESKTDDIDSLHGMIHRSTINPNDEASDETVDVQNKPKPNRRRSSRLSYSELKSQKSKSLASTCPTTAKPKAVQPKSPFPQVPPMDEISFKDWQHETSQGIKTSSSDPNSAKCPDANGKMCTGCVAFYTGQEDPLDLNQTDYSCIASGPSTSNDPVWVPPDSIKYREIKGNLKLARYYVT